MPRDISGNYTLPPGINPVISGTLIDVDWCNPTMADFAVQFNNVITRDGLLGATAPLKLIDGTVAAPGLAFAAETNTGLYREGTGLFSLAVQGVKIGQWTANGLGVTGNVIPSTDAARTLGTATLRWAVVYGQTFSDGATATGRLLDSASTTVLHGSGTQWTQQKWYTGGTERVQLTSSQFTIFGSNELLKLYTSVARGSGSNYLQFYDPTGVKGYVGYGSGVDDSFDIYNGLSSVSIWASGNKSMQLFGNGRVSFKNIHNVGPVDGTADQFLASGTYVMTTTNVANISSSAGNICQWMRVGNVVTVSGALTFTPTSGGVSTQLRISLPIPSDLTFFEQASGVLVYVASAGVPPPAARIVGDASANEALMTTTSDAGGGIRNAAFTFTYLVQ